MPNLSMTSGICLVAFFLLLQPLQAATLDPDATVSNFYSWYLHDLNAGHDPDVSDPKTISIYVSKALIQEIAHRIGSSDGIDEDYFIKAQDYLNDWVDHIATSQPKLNANKAVVDVTLGVDQATKEQLQVTLIQEDGNWKIRNVQAIGDGRNR